MAVIRDTLGLPLGTVDTNGRNAIFRNNLGIEEHRIHPSGSITTGSGQLLGRVSTFNGRTEFRNQSGILEYAIEKDRLLSPINMPLGRYDSTSRPGQTIFRNNLGMAQFSLGD